MHTLVYLGPGRIEHRIEPDPTPASGESLVRLEAVGICGSDLHVYRGHDRHRTPPVILGHEAVGRVIEGNATGSRVLVNPLMTCGRCTACTDGRPHLCSKRTALGVHRPGAFAELIAIPDRNLIPIAEEVDPVRAALAEPAANVVHAVALAARAAHRALAEGKALVLGGGAVGLLTALLLRARGCRRVRLGGTNPGRLANAARTGAAEVFDPSVVGVPDNGSYDLVFDAVGTAATHAAAVEAVAPGGVVVHIGLSEAIGIFDFRRVTVAEVTFIGTYMYTPDDLAAALTALDTDVFGDLSWVETRPLADGPRAFQDLGHGRSSALKIVLRP